MAPNPGYCGTFPRTQLLRFGRERSSPGPRPEPRHKCPFVRQRHRELSAAARRSALIYPQHRDSPPDTLPGHTPADPRRCPLRAFTPRTQVCSSSGARSLLRSFSLVPVTHLRSLPGQRSACMSGLGQPPQGGGGLRSRRAPSREAGPPGASVTTGGAMETCCLGPGLLRRLIELPAPPLSRHQLKRLEEHRYSSAGRSLLEPLMQRYWEWLVSQVPSWIAPNLITIVGLATNVFTTLVLVYYCPTATEQAPLWTYLLCAVGLFIYQSLDAIDGKQARRTNSSSPLGELFDHGCDSLSTVFVVLGTSVAVQLGTHPDWMFFCCFSGMFMFYCAHWQTYVCGTLRFGIIDVTEVQIFIISVYLLAAVGGTAFWQSTIPLLNVQMKMVPAFFTFLGAIFSCTNYFRVIFTGGVGKNGSTIAGTSVLSPVLHIGTVIILAMMIYKKSAVGLFQRHPCLYILAFGFVSAKITNKLVVAHMTKSEMHLHDFSFLGPGLLFLDQYFNSFIDEYLVLWAALVLSLFDLVRYCVSVCNQIARHLHIHVFRIRSVSTAPPAASH